jgi:phosphoenolpyruvate synthase/pyruvate phosphate dikinase
VTYALQLTECPPDRPDLIGGKAAGLSRLLRAGDVPPGFVVTTLAYRDWLAGHGLQGRLARLLEDAGGPAAVESASREIRALFEGAGPTDELTTLVGAAYAGLGEGAVAVRSSATAEDAHDASFAGQQETYLGVTGRSQVVRRVIACWASLFTPQAISYRRRLAIPASEAAMAVLVQRMVAAEAAGVMLTIDPVTGDASQVVVESALGLGAPVVGGELTPDRFVVDKVTLELRARTIVSKPFADRLDQATGNVRRVELTEEEGSAASLRDEEVLRLAELGKRIERAVGGPVDVEWALDPERRLYLLQARPETVWSARRTPIAPAGTTPMDRMVAMMLSRGSGERR